MGSWLAAGLGLGFTLGMVTALFTFVITPVGEPWQSWAPVAAAAAGVAVVAYANFRSRR